MTAFSFLPDLFLYLLQHIMQLEIFASHVIIAAVETDRQIKQSM